MRLTHLFCAHLFANHRWSKITNNDISSLHQRRDQ